MKKAFATLFLLFFCVTASAQGPWLVSDPYLATVAQPEEFVIVLNGTEYISAAVMNGDGLLFLKFDLAGLWLAQNNVTVKARNPWGESPTVPFAFTAGVPGEVGGLQIVSSDPGP